MTSDGAPRHEAVAIGRAGAASFGHLTGAAAVLVVSGLGLLLVEHLLRSHALAGVWFQAWSSEHMMQTVSIVDLKREPFVSLYFLHIQPPVLDAVRAVVAATVAETNSERLLQVVDQRLYLIWAGVYASTAALLFAWLSLASGWRTALFAAVAFCLHPAAVASATLLESTGLSALGVLWFHYELWRFACRSGSAPRLAGSVILLFLTRSIFQWPFLLLVAGCLVLLRAPTRQIARFALIAGFVICAFVGKQYALFGITYTSTFAGHNCTRALDEAPPKWKPTPPVPGLPGVLARDYKLDHSRNFNQLSYVAHGRALLSHCRETVRAAPPGKLATSLLENISVFLEPTSRYTPNAIVDRMPWRSVYDWVFQGLPLLALLLLAGLIWLERRRTEWRTALALVLPSAFIFAVCVLFEKGENMRFKFFLEPLWMLFIASQISDMARRAHAWRVKA